MEKVAVLIPVTSNLHNWKSFVETDLFNHCLKSFFTTYNDNYEYKIYLGIDSDDKFYNDINIINNIEKFINVMRNTKVEFIFLDKNIYKSKPCWIWNHLYEKAYNENYDYFIQCGSDIQFCDNDWVSNAIQELKMLSDIGVIGLNDVGRKHIDPNDDLITQTIVSRKHYDIFKFYFPPELISWCSDNWIGDIYEKENRKIILLDKKIYNLGGKPRYIIPKDYKIQYNISMLKYKDYISKFINENEIIYFTR